MRMDKNIKKVSKMVKSILKKDIKKERKKEVSKIQPQQEEQAFEYELVNKRMKITAYHGKQKELHIPEFIDHKKVTMIGKGAFKGNQNLKKVFLPESIKILGSEAFAQCENLTYAYLPVDLEVINAGCFYGCTSLREVQVPYELRKICKGAFKNCSSLNCMKTYVKSGISAERIVRRDLEDHDLPIQLEYIGEEAFYGCRSLEVVSVPFAVGTIRKRTFYGCSSLHTLTVHDLLKQVDEEAFANCTALKKMRISASLTKIGKDIFAGSKVCIVCEEDSQISRYAEKYGIERKLLPKEMAGVSSMMIPFDKQDAYKPYYTEEEAIAIEEKCELRPAVIEKITRKRVKAPDTISKYQCQDGIYKKKEETEIGRAKILMTGDLMCKQNHQSYAKEGESYNFDGAFQYVKDILQTGDLVIGNMESMTAPSLPYTCERPYVNGRPYLNAPEEFIHAVKKAGYDAVVNAQNHVYDAGTRGILETLEVLNQNQLMHTGAFAGKNDKKFLSIIVNGIHIAVLAYFDGARQAMKKANFTQYGKEMLIHMHDKKEIIENIKAAKAEGAEFIIAYCHWGREYTHDLTRRQMTFAQEAADAGVDYIMGAHSHCLQPYAVMISADGRRVPVIYSGGNFLSEIAIDPKITRDTIIASLELVRNEEGKVIIKEDGYYPCRILRDENVRGEFVIVPTNLRFRGKMRNEALRDAERRIDAVTGSQYQKMAARTGVEKKMWDGRSLSLQEVEMEKILHAPAETVTDEKIKQYQQQGYTGDKKASIVCVGQIQYDEPLAEGARSEDRYDFLPYVASAKEYLKEADLAIGNFTAMADEEYLTTDVSDEEYNANPYYSNARKEYLDALKAAGFDCLAMAHPNNVDTGVDGILKTSDAIRKSGMTSVGIAEDKNKIFTIHGIHVGVLSYTLDCYDWYKYMTGEGADRLLNIYSYERAKRDMKDLKEKGAEFVIVYVNCGSLKEKVALKGRKEVATALADAGADYVICTVPNVVSKYYHHKTEDDRIVPIATSVGTFLSGMVNEENQHTAILKIEVEKLEDGTIKIKDSCLPLERVGKEIRLLNEERV